MDAKRDCPFCGNDNVEDWGESTWSRPVKWMYCTECHAQGPRVRLERDEDEADWLRRAITAWNGRTPPDGQQPGGVVAQGGEG